MRIHRTRSRFSQFITNDLVTAKPIDNQRVVNRRVLTSLFVVCSGITLSACQNNSALTANDLKNYPAIINTSETSAKDPNKAAEIRTRLAAQYIKNNELDAAQRQLEQAFAANRRYAPAYDMMGILLQTEGSRINLEIADRYFAKAIRLDPSFMQARNNYGVYLSQMGRYQEALKQFEIAGAALGYPGRVKAIENLGLTALKLEDKSLASQAFVRVLDNDRDNITAHIELVDILLDSGHLLQAQDLYTESLTLLGKQATKSPRVLLQGIRLSQLQNNQVERQNLSRILLADFPLSPEAKKLKNWIRNPKVIWK